MPIDIFKGSIDYCLKNIPFFLFVFILYMAIEILLDVSDGPFYYIVLVLLVIVVMGYSLQVIQDVIRGGNRLPKIRPIKIIVLGMKGMVVSIFYSFIQFSLLGIVSEILNFPQFDLEEAYSDPLHILSMIYSHDVVSFIIFIVLGFVISYVCIFFMELSLAKLADGEKLRKSFNFRRIKHAIDVIGWKNYCVGYTKIILIMMVLSYINRFADFYDSLNFIVGSLTLFLSFIVESMGMGNVYKVYIENKQND